MTEALAAGDGYPSSALGAELLRCYGIRAAGPSEVGDDGYAGPSPGGAGVGLDVAIVHDPLFGSVVTCGVAGVCSDLLGDRTARLPPITDRDGEQMWRGLRAAPLLTGYRGSLPVDTSAIEDLIIRIGRLAEDLPEVADLRLMPVIVSAAGVEVAHVDLRLAAVGAEPDQAMRALREPA